MNKDVIYIEPEDDITDIIGKLENSKEKIVALVPPKKTGVLRSVVNIKLIAKAGAASEKSVVLVTTDPSVLKLAAAVRIPVTKNLQTPPAIPVVEPEQPTTEIIKTNVEQPEAGEKAETPEQVEKEPQEEATAEEEDKKDKKDDKKPKKAKQYKNPFINWIMNHKKIAILCGVGVVVLILLLVWALVIAPAVTISVTVRTNSSNFSENVTFTTKVAEEDAAVGKFYLEEKKIETPAKVEFKATGSKNVGEKASGTLVLIREFGTWGAVAPGTTGIAAGSIFVYGDHQYAAENGATLEVKDAADCDDYDASKPIGEVKDKKCTKSVSINIKATDGGAAYNIEGTKYDWSSNVAVDVIYNSSSIVGGTDRNVTIVTQADVDKAKESLSSSKESEDKAKLTEQFKEDQLAIDSSFKRTTADITATPAVGQEVGDGVTPNISTKTTVSMYAVDKTKIEEFIKAKAKLDDNQKIYSLGDPFIENFAGTDPAFTGKLKTSYHVGPKVTESDIVEKAKGKGIGSVQYDLKSINGVSAVSIEKSFFWVNSVPNNLDKITVNLKIED